MTNASAVQYVPFIHQVQADGDRVQLNHNKWVSGIVHNASVVISLPSANLNGIFN